MYRVESLSRLLILPHVSGDEFDDLFLLPEVTAARSLKTKYRLSRTREVRKELRLQTALRRGTRCKCWCRTAQQGYGAADGVRQQFTGQLRDNETGLDYFNARYYASMQGRFTSPDDILNDTHTEEPSSWNLYTYVRNNPLRYTDPDGKTIWISFIERDADGNDVYTSLQYKKGKLYTSDGKQYTGNNADALKTLNDLNELKSMDEVANAKITTLERSKHAHEIVMTDFYINSDTPKDKAGSVTPGVGSDTNLRFNPNNETEMNGNKRSPLVALAHELSHPMMPTEVLVTATKRPQTA